MNSAIIIKSTDFWVKVIGMLQQNWAVIDISEGGEVRIYFISDTGGIFDVLDFASNADAQNALRKNGFSEYSSDKKLQSFLRPPSAPFCHHPHPNGPIYSSGRYWES